MNEKGVEEPSVSRAVFWTTLLTISALAAGLRIWELGEASFWVDEIFTVRSSKESLQDIDHKTLGYVPTSIVLSLSGIPLEPRGLSNNAQWRSLGITEVRARLASCLIGILSVPILILVSRSWIGTRNALLAGALLAVAPWHIQWSQSARFYTQQFLFYNLAFVWYFVATERGSAGRLMAAVAAAALAYLTQPPALMIAGIFGLDWLIAALRGRPVLLGRTGWGLAIAGLGVCVAVEVLSQLQFPEGMSDFTDKELRDPVKTMLKALFRVDAAVLLVAAAGVPWLIGVRPRLAVYLLLGALLPVGVIAALATTLWVSSRYSFVCVWAWLVLAAIGLDAMQRRLHPGFGRVLAWSPTALVIASMLLWNFFGQLNTRGLHPRWREAFAYVSQHRAPGDVVFANPLTGRYYLEDPHVIPLPPSGKEIESTPGTRWIVLDTSDPERGPYRGFLHQAELRATFPMHAVGTRHSLFVYRAR